MTTKERPILFSAPMVRAILAGTKTQTRRMVKATPGLIDGCHDAGTVRAWVPRCPYGQPGERLWAREAWRACAEADAVPPRDMDAAFRVWYEADAPHQPGAGKYRPPMFMPRWASRITLEITDVRVERLQEISEADAKAEGITPYKNHPGRFLSEHRPGLNFPSAVAAYRDLWEQINGPGSWDVNPWVWVVEFKVAR